MFLNENRSHPYVNKFLRESFREFFTRNIMHYDYKKYPVNLVGSVAFYYKDLLKEVANELGIKIDKIIQSPIDGLAEYHKSL